MILGWRHFKVHVWLQSRFCSLAKPAINLRYSASCLLYWLLTKLLRSSRKVIYSWCSRAVLSSTNSSAKVLSTPRSARKSIRWSYKAYKEKHLPLKRERLHLLHLLIKIFCLSLDQDLPPYKAQEYPILSSTHPVQGICVECIICILPFRFTSGLKAHFPDGENVTLTLFFLSNLRRDSRIRETEAFSKIGQTHARIGTSKVSPKALVPSDAKVLALHSTYLVFWIVTVQHEGLLAIFLYNFNHEIGSGCQFRLGKQE